MAKARTIIRQALTVGLNRLSPGEQEDADLFGRCLDALASIVDEFNGGKSLLFREILTTSTPINGVSAQLGVAWPTLAAGDEILGASVQYPNSTDLPVAPITMAQYQGIAVKTLISLPQVFAHDGAATVYFYPGCAGQTVTLRTRQVAATFADLDTDYVMPAGYSSAFSALLAEAMAEVLVGGASPMVITKAAAARRRLTGQASKPGILDGGAGPGNILSGWN